MKGQWSSGMILASGARGRGFDSPLAPLFMTESYALVAQMVERKTLNLVVVGSIPTGGAFWITGLCTVRVWFGQRGYHREPS